MFPIFFSVSSRDIDYAESVWDAFPDDLIYLYSRTGAEGAHLWDEISISELPQSKMIVIFWSQNYIKSPGCQRELLEASKLVKSGQLLPVVIRIDDFPIVKSDNTDIENDEYYEALRTMLDYRTSSAICPQARAIILIQKFSAKTLGESHPYLRRFDVQKAMLEAIKIGSFKRYPTLWVSGFNAYGRETSVEEMHSGLNPNARGLTIEINEASLPKQISMRLASEAYGIGNSALSEIAEDTEYDTPEKLAEIIEKISSDGNFVIFRHSRIVEENSELPEWLDEVVTALSIGTRPKLYVISQLPISRDRRLKCEATMSDIRLPAVDDDIMKEYTAELIGHFDQDPTRWQEEYIDKLVDATKGTVGFAIPLTRSACRMHDFDHIDELLSAHTTKSFSSITTYINWAYRQLDGNNDAQRILIFLNDVSPCTLEDIATALDVDTPPIRSLGKLLDLGLVERERGELWRLTPLLARRLGHEILSEENAAWLKGVYRKLSTSPIAFEEDEHSYIKIESRIQSSLWSGGSDIPRELVKFISASHWFQAGIRLYHARHRKTAFRLLKKAFEARMEFRDASRAEIVRYYGLSAVQNREYEVASKCMDILNSSIHTKGVAANLQAFIFESKGQYEKAIPEYVRSLDLNKGKTSRIERTYRPLIKCILKSKTPNYAIAESYSLAWIKVKETIFSLKTHAQVYLEWKYEEKGGPASPSNIDELISNAKEKLRKHSGSESALAEVHAIEYIYQRNFIRAEECYTEAIRLAPRFELRAERWRSMAESGIPEFSIRALEEIEKAKNTPDYRSNWEPFLAHIAESYALCLSNVNQSMSKLNTLAVELGQAQIAKIIARIRKK